MDCVKHVTFKPYRALELRKAKREKSWIARRKLGQGTFGCVTLEVESNGDLRAVKKLSKVFCSKAKIDYRKELLAMAKLSRVRNLSSLDGFKSSASALSYLKMMDNHIVLLNPS